DDKAGLAEGFACADPSTQFQRLQQLRRGFRQSAPGASSGLVCLERVNRGLCFFVSVVVPAPLTDLSLPAHAPKITAEQHVFRLPNELHALWRVAPLGGIPLDDRPAHADALRSPARVRTVRGGDAAIIVC